MPDTKQKHRKGLTEYFSNKQDNTIITSDGQLTDEPSLNLFNKGNGYIPVMFIKGNPDDLKKAIEIGSQDFSSKPGKEENPEKKLNTDILQVLLKNPFTISQAGNLLKFWERKKTRLLVKHGTAHLALLLNQIALIYTKDKSVYVVDNDSKKYLIDKTMTELEEELDRSIFFRANRQYIVSINFIKSFKVLQKVKLLVDIDLPELEEPIIVSQQVAPAFKKWMNDA